MSDRSRHAGSAETTGEVLAFYKQLPFNFYSNAVDTAVQLARSNRIKAYPPVHALLKASRGQRMIDVGCGAGWFVNSCAHYYGAASQAGIDLNPVALRQARSVARLMEGCENVEFIEANVFEFEPDVPLSELVNSLGVLHHTPDCHGAVRRVVEWIEPGGWLQLGLYHLPMAASRSSIISASSSPRGRRRTRCTRSSSG